MTKLEIWLIAAIILILGGAAGGYVWEHRALVAMEATVAVANQAALDAASKQRALDAVATKEVNDEAEKSLAAFGQHTADVLVQLHNYQARGALLAAAGARAANVQPIGPAATAGAPVAGATVPGVCPAADTAHDPLTSTLGYELKDALKDILYWRDYARKTGQSKE